MKAEVAKINSKFEETQKTLALILVKLINPSAIQRDGFVAPLIGQTSSPSEVITPTSNITSQSSIPTPANSTAVNNGISTAANDSISTPPNNYVSTTANNSVSPANTTAINNSVSAAANDSVSTSANNSISTAADNSVSHANTSISTAVNNDVSTAANDSVSTSANNSVSTAADNSVSPANTTAINNGVSVAANDSVSTPTPSDFETVGTSGIIDPGRVLYLRRKSCSRRNFSAKLNQEVFDIETRKKSNIAGKLGKMKLNPVLVDYIRSLTFQHFPLEQDQTEKREWAQCVIAIDVCNRGLIKKVSPSSE